MSPETKEKMRERLLWERFNGTPAYDCDGNCGAASDATCRAATPWGHMQAAGFGAPLPPGAKPAPVATSGVSLEELTAHLIAHPKQAYSDVAALLLKTYAINRRPTATSRRCCG